MGTSSVTKQAHAASILSTFLLAVPGITASVEASTGTDAGKPELRFSGRVEAETPRVHAIDLAEGDFVQGTVSGRQVRLVLRDRFGGSIRILSKGIHEQDEFMFVAGDLGPYALEVAGPLPGEYRLEILRVIPRTRQKPPDPIPESPRLRALAASLGQGGDTTAFWHAVAAGGAPLVEKEDVVPPLAQGRYLVTFLWRGARHGVRLLGGPSSDHDELRRLGSSDVWYRSYRVPDSTRLAYLVAPDVPELDASPSVRRRAILATAQRDPFNARNFPEGPEDAYDGASLLELPQAPTRRWEARQPGTPSGTLEVHRLASPILGNTRDIHLYRSSGYRPGAEGNALVVLFDGERYVREVPSPAILDNLVAAGALPPTAAILISNPSNDARSAELPPNEDFARFLAEELMPWAGRQGIVARPARTVIAGASYGGLAAAWAGFKHPGLFGNVYSQSGSFWWSPGGDGDEGEPEWLTRRFAASHRLPLRFQLDAGLFETGRGNDPGILETTRHLRDVLTAKGYPVQYREYAAGHGFEHWRTSLADGLLALIGRPSPP